MEVSNLPVSRVVHYLNMYMNANTNKTISEFAKPLETLAKKDGPAKPEHVVRLPKKATKEERDAHDAKVKKYEDDLKVWTKYKSQDYLYYQMQYRLVVALRKIRALLTKEKPTEKDRAKVPNLIEKLKTKPSIAKGDTKQLRTAKQYDEMMKIIGDRDLTKVAVLDELIAANNNEYMKLFEVKDMTSRDKYRFQPATKVIIMNLIEIAMIDILNNAIISAQHDKSPSVRVEHLVQMADKFDWAVIFKDTQAYKLIEEREVRRKVFMEEYKQKEISYLRDEQQRNIGAKSNSHKRTQYDGVSFEDNEVATKFAIRIDKEVKTKDGVPLTNKDGTPRLKTSYKWLAFLERKEDSPGFIYFIERVLRILIEKACILDPTLNIVVSNTLKVMVNRMIIEFLEKLSGIFTNLLSLLKQKTVRGDLVYRAINTGLTFIPMEKRVMFESKSKVKAEAAESKSKGKKHSSDKKPDSVEQANGK